MEDGIIATEGSPAVSAGVMLEDARQSLRIRRFLMAAATSLLMPALLFAGAALGLLQPAVAVRMTLVVIALLLVVYSIFRSGLNLRFRDPSLTAEQITVSFACTAFIAYNAEGIREAVAVFYYVTMLFGVLRLNTLKLLALSLIALLAHATALWAWHGSHPGADTSPSLMQLMVLAGILPWFAAMGGYVNSLRHRLSDSNRQLKIAFERLEQVAIHDDLTGVFNHRFLIDVLARESSRARRLGTAFSICLFDLDHFKNINDTLGHAAGDAVLKHFARLGSSDLRGVDVFGRYGGEEFLLILPDTGQQGARASAERIRAAFENDRIPRLPADRRFTVTAGITTSRPQEDVESLLARADGALYEGKAAGRNCVVAVS